MLWLYGESLLTVTFLSLIHIVKFIYDSWSTVGTFHFCRLQPVGVKVKVTLYFYSRKGNHHHSNHLSVSEKVMVTVYFYIRVWPSSP